MIKFIEIGQRILLGETVFKLIHKNEIEVIKNNKRRLIDMRTSVLSLNLDVKENKESIDITVKL